MTNLTDKQRKLIRTHIVNNLRGDFADFDSEFRFFDDNITCVFVRKGFYTLHANNTWDYCSFDKKDLSDFASKLSDTELLTWQDEYMS